MLRAGLTLAGVCSILSTIPLQTVPAKSFSEDEALAKLTSYDIEWKQPALRGSMDSMPIGNGSLAANVWVESGGDLMLYLARDDAWAADAEACDGLLKLGRLRIRLGEEAFPDTEFSQRLRLEQGAIEILGANSHQRLRIKVWVDALKPVLRLEVESEVPLPLQVTFESLRTPEELTKRPPDGYTRWRGKLLPDKTLEGREGAISWIQQIDYQSRGDASPAQASFGALVRGNGLRNSSPQSLISIQPAKTYLIEVMSTSVSGGEQDWITAMDSIVSEVSRASSTEAWLSHVQWWRAFWTRSWIFVSGDKEAEAVTQAYILQRFMNACASRGAYPMKFNGSLFTMDYQLKGAVRDKEGAKIPFEVLVNGDFRRWGGYYWFQNTRLIYWPMLADGDFDLMKPFFRMYGAILEANAPLTSKMYGFEGASYFMETTSPWGGLKKVEYDMPGRNTLHYFTCSLEYLAMALEYWRYTQDDAFAAKSLVPAARQVLSFLFQFYGRDERGQLLLDPHNSGETYLKVRNPSPDLAGLRWILSGLLLLPDEVATASDKANWTELLKILPPVPVGDKNGQRVILPAEDLREGQRANSENPELYAVFPFRLFGLFHDSDLARQTYHQRDVHQTGCWYQDPIHAAFAGLAQEARDGVVSVANATDANCRFPGFRGMGHDYTPDMDHSGVLMTALQAMILQTSGKEILLLPAWPAGWDAQFRLHAPFSTVVEGNISAGNASSVNVTPSSRTSDVRIFQP
jgi:alpha-L-fucosidase 2